MPFVRFTALCLSCRLCIWLYFAFSGGLKGVLWCGCVFVWVWGFSWLVWLLCACGVRRLYDLMRVCLFFLSSLLLLLSLFLLSSACPLGCLASALGLVLSLFVGCCCFFFPYGCMRKKKGRKVFLRPLLSCCVLLYLVAALYSSYSFGVSPFIS